MEPSSPTEGCSRHRIRATIWKYFELDSINNKTICLICGTFLSHYGGGTSSMRNHVRNKHKSISAIEGLNREKDVDETSPGNKYYTNSAAKSVDAENGDQPAIPVSLVHHAPLPTGARHTLFNIAREEQKQIMQQKVLDMCTKDVLPLHIIHGEGFQKFIHSLEPSIEMPSLASLTFDINMKYQEEKAAAFLDLQTIDHSVGVTVDNWTSAHNQDFMTLTIHYISNCWQQEKRVITTQLVTAHTSASDANEMFQKTLQKCGINLDPVSIVVNPLFMTTDVLTPCFGIVLQTAIDKGFKLSHVAKVIQDCQRIVSFFVANQFAAKELNKRQFQMDLKVQPLMLDYQGKWLTTYFMLVNVLDNRLPIYAVLQDTELLKANKVQQFTRDLSPDVWDMLVLLLPVLKPLQVTTQVMSNQQYPSLSMVFPILFQLLTFHLKPNLSDSADISSFKECVSTELMRLYRYEDTEHNLPALIASALDPRYKSLKCLSTFQQGVVRIAILSNISVIQSQSRSARNHDYREPPIKREKTNTSEMEMLLGDLFEGDTTEEKSGEYTQTILEQELDSYEDEKTAPTLSNPLHWWKANFVKYPHLATLAQSYLCLPSTCAPAALIFSTAQTKVSQNRTSLDPDTANQIIFLHENRSYSALRTMVAAKDFIQRAPPPPFADTASSSSTSSILGCNVKQEMDSDMWNMVAPTTSTSPDQ